MPDARRLVRVALGLAALAGCRIEERAPSGSRRDERELQRLIVAYYRVADDSIGRVVAPEAVAIAGAGEARAWREGVAAERPGGAAPAGRPVRVDLRQQGDLAAAWVLYRPVEGAERFEHLLMRRGAEGWRVIAVARAGLP